MVQSKQSIAIRINLAKMNDKRGIAIIKRKDQLNFNNTVKKLNDEIRFNREILKGYPEIEGVEYDEETKRQAKKDIEDTLDRLVYHTDRHDAIMKL